MSDRLLDVIVPLGVMAALFAMCALVVLLVAEKIQDEEDHDAR